MPATIDLIQRDHKHIWHPCSQMKDYETLPPLDVVRARGSYIELRNGQTIIDAISSWWCKSLGHNHPRLKQALSQQMELFEHVILANTTHQTVVEFAEKLAKLTPNLSKVFFASDGSSAVEIAMKMSLHSRLLTGQKERCHFLSLENSYHGETVGTLSVSDVGLYRDPYQPLFFPSKFIPGLPYVSGPDDPLWSDCQTHWERIEAFLDPLAKTTTAILIEPIVQGAGGMKIYSKDFLTRLRAWTLANDIHLIADEIMTGIGRTGKMLACDHAAIEPEFITLSKGLTSGWLPLSVVLTSSNMYDLFYDDYQTGKSFLHSHTYSGNALAVRVGLEVLNIMEEENTVKQAETLGKKMFQSMTDIAKRTKKLKNIRSIGAICAADFVNYNADQRTGFQLFKKALSLGAFLRPVGNTLYWLPPLNMSHKTLDELQDITEQALEVV